MCERIQQNTSQENFVEIYMRERERESVKWGGG